MLYDPKWQKPSIKSFIGWLETQPPGKRYDFNNFRGECLMGQYMAAMGIEWCDVPERIAGKWYMTNYSKTVSTIFGTANVFGVMYERPWTFGGALDRARAWAAAH